MKKTFKLLTTAVALSLGLTTATANATLISRLGGAAVYDTDLDITWLANANASTINPLGLMDWATANAWAAGLTVDGIGGWRLPTTLQPDPSCDLNFAGDSFGLNCTGSEMGHLFYTELGGVAAHDIVTTHNASYGLFNNFQYMGYYWSGTAYSGMDYAWYLNWGNGYQNYDDKRFGLYAMAVHPGDVGAVPIPAAAWLFGSGLWGLVGMARRKA